MREGHFINTETKRALGALTPDCGAGIGRCRVGSGSVRKTPAVLQEGVRGTDLPTLFLAFKCTHANSETAGEWERPGGHASRPAWGRLSCAMLLSLLGERSCTAILFY